MTSRVLLVEDASSFRKMLGTFLRKNNYEVYEAWSLASALRLLPSVQPNLMLLDLQLEDGDGYSLLREYADRDLSILVISAREEVGDRVISLELGAEDYMVKPIDLRELLLRMRRIERLAASRNYGSIIDFGAFVLDLVNRKIVRPGFPDVSLSHSEFLLARILMEADGKILTRDTIARRVLGKSNVASSRAVDVGSASATRISSADSAASRSTSAKERSAGASGAPTVVAMDQAAATSRHIRRSRAWTDSPTASARVRRSLRRRSGAGSAAKLAIALSSRVPPAAACTTRDACSSPCRAR